METLNHQSTAVHRISLNALWTCTRHSFVKTIITRDSFMYSVLNYIRQSRHDPSPKTLEFLRLYQDATISEYRDHNKMKLDIVAFYAELRVLLC